MAASAKASEKKGNKFVGFFKDLKAELMHRITWASKEEVKKAFWASISFCLLYIIIVYIMDLGFQKLFKIIFNIG